MFRIAALAVVFSLAAVSAIAEIVVRDAYARASRPGAPTGAAFMVIENTGDAADRLVSARSDVARMVELHSHVDAGNGVMQMVKIEDGIEIPAGETHALARGGDHVMLMGLQRSLEQGSSISVTLTFEQAGDVTIDIPVDNERAADH